MFLGKQSETIGDKNAARGDFSRPHTTSEDPNAKKV